MKKKKFNVAIVAGSFRKESISLRLAKFIASLNSDKLGLEIISISNMPIYNEDLENDGPPQGWQSFRKEIKTKDAVLFITPEYNRSVPAALKNAIDVGSAPHGHNVFNNKPAAIISLSPGKMGAFGANHHLRQSLVFLNMPTMQQPEMYLGNSEELFSLEGSILNDSTKGYIVDFIESFTKWICSLSEAYGS